MPLHLPAAAHVDAKGSGTRAGQRLFDFAGFFVQLWCALRHSPQSAFPRMCRSSRWSPQNSPIRKPREQARSPPSGPGPTPDPRGGGDRSLVVASQIGHTLMFSVE